VSLRGIKLSSSNSARKQQQPRILIAVYNRVITALKL